MHPKLRRWADTIHKWTALVVLVFFILHAITGAILVNNERTMRWLDPAMYSAKTRTEPEADLTRVLAALPVLDADRVYASIVLPIEHDFPALAIVAPRVRAVPELVTIDPATGAVLGRKPVFTNITVLANLWHETMFAGPAGPYTTAALGLALVLVSATGLLRWWPVGSLASGLRLRWAGGVGRTIRLAHGPIGAILALAFLWLGITGAVLVGRPFLEPLVGGFVETTTRTELDARGLPRPGVADEIGPLRAAEIARAAMPEHRLMAVIPMSSISPDHAFAFADRSWRLASIRVSGAGQVIERYTPAEAPPASQLFDWMLPLHRGSLLPEWARMVWYVFALGLLGMAASGLVINRLKARQRKAATASKKGPK
jgi:uncharacterized iron-regulated membrane protein